MPFFLTGLLVGSLAVASHPLDYDFKTGHWLITAKTMQPDQSWLTGQGSGHVYRNAVGLLQDELCIDMQHTDDVVGTTVRSFDASQQLWHITWLTPGKASGHGLAQVADGQLVERFTGVDQYGAYIDEMRFTLHNPDHYTANLSRTYQNGGVKLDCIWCYEAKRSLEPTDHSCDLLPRDSDLPGQ